MTEGDLERYGRLALNGMEFMVCVKANDYAYSGRLAGLTIKESGAILATVEDSNGRLFIHNASQIELEQPIEQTTFVLRTAK